LGLDFALKRDALPLQCKRYVEDPIDRVEAGRAAGVVEAINQKVMASMTSVVDQAAWGIEVN
jgi:hypothetical protein